MRHIKYDERHASAGLGNPPNKWDNQKIQAMNDVIKEET